MKIPYPSKVLSIVLASVLGGALLAVLIGVAVMIITMPAEEASLADRLPAAQTILFARTKDAPTAQTVLGRAQVLWNLPTESLPLIEGKGSFEFALFTNSGGTTEWVVEHRNLSGTVVANFSDEALRSSFAQRGEAEPLSDLIVWQEAIDDEPMNITLFATATLPAQEETFTEALRHLLLPSEYVALAWNDGGNGKLLTESRDLKAANSFMFSSTDKTLVSAFFARPSQLLVMLGDALSAADTGLEQGMHGILTAYMRSLIGTEDAESDVKLLMQNPLSILVATGSGGAKDLAIHAAMTDDGIRTDLERNMERELVRGGIVRTTELLRGIERREVVAPEQTASGVTMDGPVVWPLPSGRELLLTIKGENLRIATKETLQTPPLTTGKSGVLSEGSVDLPWLKAKRDELFPFVTLPAEFPWSFFMGETLRWQWTMDGDVLVLEWEKS